MQRERRLTKGETPEAPTKKLDPIVTESALTFEDRHAAYCAGLDDGMTYQVRVDAEYAAADGIPDVSAQLSRIEALLGQVLLRMGGVG